MTTTNSKGVLMFAHNNVEIDYLKLAIVNSYLIQKNLGLTKNQITIVTDSHSLKHTETELSKKVIKGASSNIVIVEKDTDFKHKNIRTFHDTVITSKDLSFYNINRCDAYDISPYDETLLLDVDYLVLSDRLNHCWGHNNEIMMNWEYSDVMFGREYSDLERIGPMGISHYWATVVYFRKTQLTESFFNVAKHVAKNTHYYKDLYKWNGSLFRNDYSFSIAAHVISGFQDRGLPQLPITLYKTFDLDDVHSSPSPNELILYLEKINCPGDFIMTRWKNIDVHIMNKWAINRVAKELLKHAITA